MDFKIEWLRSAQNDFDAEIAYVLTEYGFITARKIYMRLMKRVALLSSFPQIGTLCPDLHYFGFEVRKLPIRRLTIFYSPQTDKVTIIAVWNNYQDPERLSTHLQNII